MVCGPLFLFSAPWPVVGLCIDKYLLQTEAAMLSVEKFLIKLEQ